MGRPFSEPLLYKCCPGRNDNHLKTDRLSTPHCAFYCRNKRIHGIDIRSTANLGDHDLVKPIARLFQQIDNIRAKQKDQ